MFCCADNKIDWDSDALSENKGIVAHKNQKNHPAGIQNCVLHASLPSGFLVKQSVPDRVFRSAISVSEQKIRACVVILEPCHYSYWTVSFEVGAAGK